MGIREGLLALLAAGPNHGYQLKVDFEAATGDAWSLNVGQVYSTLQRLERDELVEVDHSDDEGRIAYRLTAAGREELADWLARPVPRKVTNRDEVSMKLLLVIAGGPGDPRRIVEVQRESTMGDLQDYTHLRSRTDPDDIAWNLHLDRLAIRSEAELRWLDRVERRLDEHDRRGTGADAGSQRPSVDSPTTPTTPVPSATPTSPPALHDTGPTTGEEQA